MKFPEKVFLGVVVFGGLGYVCLLMKLAEFFKNNQRNYARAEMECGVKFKHNDAVDAWCIMDRMSWLFLECLCEGIDPQSFRDGKIKSQQCSNGTSITRERHGREWQIISPRNNFFDCANGLVGEQYKNQVTLYIRNDNKDTAGCSGSFLRGPTRAGAGH